MENTENLINKIFFLTNYLKIQLFLYEVEFGRMSPVFVKRFLLFFFGLSMGGGVGTL